MFDFNSIGNFVEPATNFLFNLPGLNIIFGFFSNVSPIGWGIIFLCLTIFLLTTKIQLVATLIRIVVIVVLLGTLFGFLQI